MSGPAAAGMTAEELRAGIATIMAGYRRMLMDPAPTDDAKAFGQWQASCRSALAHVEHLMKVGHALGATADQPDLLALIAEAQVAVRTEGVNDEEEAA